MPGSYKSLDDPNGYLSDGYTSASPSEKLIRVADKVGGEKTPLLTSMKSRKKRRALQNFYSEQADYVNSYRKDNEILAEMGDVDIDGNVKKDPQELLDEASRRSDAILAKVVLAANVLLLIAKVVAAVQSGSLSVVSTVIDSAVDLISGVVVWATVQAIEKRDPYEYPRGRNKLEPLAVIIVSIVMGVANIVMIIQSVELILQGSVNPKVDAVTISILVGGSVVKLVLYILCRRQGTTSSEVLGQDQRNDVITNMVALACALIGHYAWVYMDPLGAILVCTYISVSWFFTASEQIPILTGKIASTETINRIIRVAVSHDDRIQCLDTVLVYHYGTKVLVEMHVVLDPDMSLRESHDITAPLQEKLERLPIVERAFVHCDYELDGVKQ